MLLIGIGIGLFVGIVGTTLFYRNNPKYQKKANEFADGVEDKFDKKKG